ncbi:MAG: carboxypeptidase-like regulatory domain-containing protein [Planctomycetota bacterium]|nr:carboxypeptidase-like regulatory domain-containing protein [Planctomycetota bacterium]
MRKLFLPLLILLAAVVAWFVFSGDDPTMPGGNGADPAGQGAPVEAGALETGGTQDPGPDPGLGRTEVTNAGSGAAELAAGRAGEIRGQVLTPGGQPLAGASVILFRRSQDSAFMLVQDHSATVDAKLTTDRDGWYRVRGLAAGTAWDVWAWHEDFAFAEGGAVEGFSGTDQELPPIRMVQGFVLEVRVVDMADRGVEGARVELTLDGMPDAVGENADPLGRRFVAISESDGFAGFESLGPGAWVLRAKKEGYGDGWLRPIILITGREPDVIRLLLGPEFGLSGSVVSANGPVAGALVEVVTDPPGVGPSFHSLSDEEGNYAISGLPEGDFMLSATRRGYLRARAQGIRGEAPFVLHIEMQEIGGISGRLLGADGKPARSGQIEIWRTIRGLPPYIPTGEVVAVDDPEGRFAIELEGGGSFILLARAEGCAPTWSEVIQTRTDPVKLGDWRLPAGGSLHGVLVVGRDGAPLENALIKLMPRGWDPRGEESLFIADAADSSEVPPMHARSGPGGVFSLSHLPPGSYSFSIEHPGAVTRALAIDPADGADRDLGTIRLEAASGLIVRAFDAEGAPLAGGNLTLSTSENGLGARKRLLNASGEARLTGLASGDYWASAIEGGGWFGRTSMPKKIWLGPGETIEIEIRLEN